MCIQFSQYLILREESRKRRYARYSNCTDEKDSEDKSHPLLPSQSTHLCNILFSVEGVDDRTCGQKQECLEKGVSSEVEYSCSETTRRHRHTHITELADG